MKIRDRGAGEGGERIRFTSAILPRWARRTRSLDALLPVLYLRGVSMGRWCGEAPGPGPDPENAGLMENSYARIKNFRFCYIARQEH